VPRDLRKYASRTNIQLAVGGLLLVFVVGVGLIALIYGPGAALMGFLCILGGVILIGLIALLVFGLDVILKRINKE
jgi:hypothetical protein